MQAGTRGLTEKTIRVGVIGLGKMGLLHAGLANSLRGSRLAAVADESATVLDAFRAIKPHLPVYRDHVQMLDSEQLDAAFITSPTHLHVPMAMDCVGRGLPFFLEKPLSPQGQDAIPLLRALDANPLPNMVGFMTRHVDTFWKAKKLVESGCLGRLIHLKTTMYVAQLFKAGKGWRYDKETSGGGVVITQNSHLIDLLLWLFGPIRCVAGHTRSWYSRTVEDFAHVYFEFSSGLSGYMDTSWSMRHHRTVDVVIDVQGERGTLSISEDCVKLFLDENQGTLPKGWSTWQKPDLFRGVEVDIGGPEYTRQDGEFLRAVSDGTSVESDVWSAFRVQKVIDAIYLSASRSGEPVSPAEET